MAQDLQPMQQLTAVEKRRQLQQFKQSIQQIKQTHGNDPSLWRALCGVEVQVKRVLVDGE